MQTISKQQIKHSKIFSPGIIGGEIVYFLPTTNHCFFMKHSEEGEYVRDNGGKYAKLDIDAVVEARLLYLYENLESEKFIAVKEMLAEIENSLINEANAIKTKINNYLAWQLNDYTSMGDLDAVYGSAHTPTIIANNNTEAKAFIEHFSVYKLKEYAATLSALISGKNYEYLYRLLNFNEGKIQTSFKPGLLIDRQAFKKLNLLNDAAANSNTDLTDTVSLHQIAKTIVEKMYHPEI